VSRRHGRASSAAPTWGTGLRAMGAVLGRWAGLIFIVGMSAACGAVVTLAIVGDSYL
jgi:hypothetical protein